MEVSILLLMQWALPQVVKWLSKEERSPRRENLEQSDHSGGGMVRIPENGDLGVSENQGARHRLLPHTLCRGGAPGLSNSLERGPYWWTAANQNNRGSDISMD
jgi:hypothetical protein